MSGIQKVGVVGCGLMGRGIAQVCAAAGYDTVVREVNQELLDAGLGAVRKQLDRAVDKGKLESAVRDATMGRLSGTVSLEDLADCGLIIEAIVENIEAKKDLLGVLDRQSPEHDRRIPDKVRREVLRFDGYRCVKCGWCHEFWDPSDPRHLEIHHIKHHAKGGANTVDNLTTVCTVCHDAIHAS